MLLTYIYLIERILFLQKKKKNWSYHFLYYVELFMRVIKKEKNKQKYWCSQWWNQISQAAALRILTLQYNYSEIPIIQAALLVPAKSYREKLLRI